jgi:hypothetical protein
MKKILYAILLITSCATAQNTHFGVQLTNESYDIEAGGDLNGGYGQSRLLFGGFADHKLNESFGVKGSVSFGHLAETHYEFINSGTATAVFSEAELNVLQIQGLLKFDVNSSYRKGFYLAAGLRMNNISGVEIDDAPGLEDSFYRNSNFAMLGGFGTVIVKHFSLDFLFDYGFTSTLEGPNTASTIGGIVNLNIDFSSLFGKKRAKE